MVANVGIVDQIHAEEYKECKQRKMIDVNFDCAFWTAQAVANVMTESNMIWSIIFTVSISDMLVNIIDTQTAYNANNVAVINLTTSLVVEWSSLTR